MIQYITNLTKLRRNICYEEVKSSSEFVNGMLICTRLVLLCYGADRSLNLREVLRQQRMSWPTICHYVLGLVSAADFLHQRDILYLLWTGPSYSLISLSATFPRTRTSYGDRSFAVHGPVVWNSLPHDLRSTDLSLATFRNRLKTFLFDADT